MKILLTHCWQRNCEDPDGKKVIVNIDPEKNVFCNEWKYSDIKFQVMTQSMSISEL